MSRVLMLVINPMTSDSRVEREARALGEVGHVVTVVATAAHDLPREEQKDHYSILRIPYRRTVKERVVSRWLATRFRVRESRIALGIVAEVDRSLATRFLLYWHRLVLMGEFTVARLRWAMSGSALKLVKSRILVKEYWQSIASRITSEVDRPDVIHAHDLGTLAAAVRLANAWEDESGRPRVVYDSHELYVDQNPRWTRLQRWLWMTHEWRWIRKADQVITVSPEIAETLERRYQLRVPSVVIYNSPDEDGASHPSDIRSDLGLDEGTPLGVYVGAVKPDRGVESLVLALSGWKECHLAFVGAGPSKHVEMIREKARALGLANRIHFVPMVSPRFLTSYLRTADVGVHPMRDTCLNHRLALPNKLFDYVFAGIPLAVSDLPVMGGFVKSHEIGVLFEPDDPRSIAAAMRSVVADKATYEPDTALRAQLRSLYGWPTQASKLRDAYAMLMIQGSSLEDASEQDGSAEDDALVAGRR